MNGNVEWMVCPVEVFDEKSNISHWKAKMESFFQVIEVLEVVTTGFDDNEFNLGDEKKRQLSQNRKKDNVAKMWITVRVNFSVFEKISDAQTSKHMWDTLSSLFENHNPGDAFSSGCGGDGNAVVSNTVSASSTLDLDSRLVPQTMRRMDNKMNDLSNYLSLYKAAIGSEWKEAREFIDNYPEALTSKITIASETALHIAVGTGNNRFFVEKLVRRMSPEELAVTDQNGDTALSVAAMVGNIDVAKLLVNKNPDLPNIASESELPIHRAAQYGHKAMVQYMLAVTRSDIIPSPFSGESGVKLFVYVVIAEFYDIAIYLVKLYPELATMEHKELGSPLCVLAEKPHAFPSGSHHNNYNFLNPFYWRNVKGKKLVHQQVLDLVKRLCMIITGLEHAKAVSMLQKPLHIAAKLGVLEMVEEIVEAFPPAIWSANEENHNVFQLAVINRRENVFNLIYQMSDYKLLVTRHIDPAKNNILHLAGKLPSPDRLNLVPGAVLQMQRELQWYQEVEKFVQPVHKVGKNTQGKTPALVFSNEHQNLVKEGEKWMKDTATSCTVAAALIATVVFAAAITVPGGNDQNKGIPLFIMPKHVQRKAFIVFGVFDAISLSSSVTSIMIFLSILTSRYAEADFLTALPKRLIFGLSMLFISITTMMIAFSTALYLVFGQNQLEMLSWVCALAIIPVISFTLYQIPLFIDIGFATFGPGIFGKQGNRKIH